MTSVNFTGFSMKMDQAQALVQQVMPKAYDFFEKTTPVRSGNARNSTRLNRNKIEAQYPYASVLDAGRGFRDGQWRGSDQAPQGIYGLTFNFISQKYGG